MRTKITVLRNATQAGTNILKEPAASLFKIKYFGSSFHNILINYLLVSIIMHITYLLHMYRYLTI